MLHGTLCILLIMNLHLLHLASWRMLQMMLVYLLRRLV
jgi:hypothetical protein